MAQTRREFLQSLAAVSSVVSLTPTMPGFLQRVALANVPASGESENVLVVLQLTGGNDGLNTVVPFADDVYGRSRKTLRLTKQDVITIDSYLGFHPQLTGFEKLLGDGHLAVVHGVGYPKSDRGHDAAMRHWHTARPEDSNCPTGWVGRTVDVENQPGDVNVPAAFVGPIQPPFALRAEASIVPALRRLEDWKPIQRDVADSPSSLEPSVTDNPLLDTVRRAIAKGETIGKRVEQVLAQEGTGNGSTYPNFTLAGQLHTVAQLIQADVGIRIFFVELGGGGIGGFDNHANQRDNHAALLRELGESVAAFVGDLRRRNRLSQVLLMTFSEFGRTVSENGRRGTDHGAAAPVFLVGGRVKGGLVGQHPALTDLDQDGLRFHTDFRRLYATVLQNWLGYDAQEVLGDAYDPVDVLG